jgi:alkyldihydroxyacetonephosphate synthase
MREEAMKWWGWGAQEERYELSDPGRFWAWLEEKLGTLPCASRIASLDAIPLDPPRLSPSDLGKLRALCGERGVSVDAQARLTRALGKSYVDLVRIRQGAVLSAPDAVVFPEQEEHVQALLELAAARDWVVIPFGGGTSVVGGVEPIPGGRPVVTVDLGRLNRILSIDDVSNTARVQAGIRGPDLEAQLNRRGFTLGHFPQSFEFSTLGGWIATRSAGQNSTKYGKIERMVVSLRMVTPRGAVETPTVPAEAAGPSLLQCLIGSEGILGIITEAVIRLHPVPPHRAFASYLFPDFLSGVNAVRAMMQAGIRPAVVRLSDPEETAMAALLSRPPRPPVRDILGRWYVRWRGFDLDQGALLILVLEGEQVQVATAKRQAHRLFRRALHLGGRPSRLWMKARFLHPYLRDELMDRSVLVDTLETAATWERLPGLYAEVRHALSQAIGRTAPGGLVLTHLSHAYRDGASLYFIFMARQHPGHEVEQWQLIKDAATEAILKDGGALSHHHGIGRMHKGWIRRYLGPQTTMFLEQLKGQWDPQHIMNPGKLVDD